MGDAGARVYFFSLDADSSIAVAAARRFYRLPYFRARMARERTDGGVHVRSERTAAEAPAPAEFSARYRPVGDVFQAGEGSLEHWLVERYCLYTLDDRRRVLRGEIHHPPWPLQPATADIEIDTMGAEVGLALDGEPLLHYARRQDVVFWTLEAT